MASINPTATGHEQLHHHAGDVSTTAAGPATSQENTRRKKKIIGVSTKMYFSAARTDSFLREVCSLLVSEKLDDDGDVDIFIIPDFVSVTRAVEIVREYGLESKVMIGAQDCHFEDFGAFTGRISPSVLREVGCGIVELGHAELNEGRDVVREKAKAVVRNGMVPLVCCGERVKGEDVEVVGREVVEGLRGIEGEVVVAYEPVWAIGQREPAEEGYVKGVVGVMRRELGERRGVRIIYGGSAGMGLWERLDGVVDGLFLGRFGHEVERFLGVVREVAGGK